MNPAHYPSLDLCKKLTEEGFPQTEMYIWEFRHRQLNKEFEITIRDNCYEWDYEEFRNFSFCPSIAELFDELPTWRNLTPIVEIVTNELLCPVRLISADWEFIKAFWWNETDWIPNALAEMWLWLKENNLLNK